MYPSGSVPPCIYGTPKMHQFSSSDSFLKLRLIVPSVSPLVPNDYFCKDTFSFVPQIKNENLSKKFLVSYDVTSPFTNTPL